VPITARLPDEELLLEELLDEEFDELEVLLLEVLELVELDELLAVAGPAGIEHSFTPPGTAGPKPMPPQTKAPPGSRPL
jgi:hypothetical protein